MRATPLGAAKEDLQGQRVLSARQVDETETKHARLLELELLDLPHLVAENASDKILPRYFESCSHVRHLATRDPETENTAHSKETK